MTLTEQEQAELRISEMIHEMKLWLPSDPAHQSRARLEILREPGLKPQAYIGRIMRTEPQWDGKKIKQYLEEECTKISTPTS